MDVRLIGTHMSIPLANVVDNPVQPPVRTTPEAMKHLEDEILASCIIATIVVVGREDLFILCDGHRRVTAARKLGFTHLDALVLPPETDERQMFISLNKVSRSMSGRDWWTMYARCPETIESFPSTARTNLLGLKAFLGQRLMVSIGEEGKRSHAIYKDVCSVMGALAMYPDMTKGSKPITGGDVFFWITKHEQTRAAIELLADGLTHAAAAKLRKAILNDTPIKKRDKTTIAAAAA